MTLRHLEIFLTVCQFQSMTKAAEQLNMSQPAISMTIKELEGYYGVALFDRMNRKLYLTRDGEILKKYASNILHQYHEVHFLLKDQTQKTNCHFGVNISLGESLLPMIVKDINEHYPAVELKITIDNSSKIANMVENNQLDFAIIDTIETNHTIQSIPFYKDEMVIVVKKGYPYHIKELSDLLNYPLLLREKGSGNRSCVDTVFEVYDLKCDPTLESASDLSILDMVKNGFGIGILPGKLIQEYGDGLETIKIENISFIRHFYMIYSSKKYLSTIITQIIEQLSKAKKWRK